MKDYNCEYAGVCWVVCLNKELSKGFIEVANYRVVA